MRRECDNLLLYIANELNDNKQMEFEEHLNHCTECTKEYKELSQAWSALQFDYIETDVPESLKEEVLDFVFKHDTDSLYEPLFSKLKEFVRVLQKQFTPFTAGIITLLFIAMAGLGIWSVQQTIHQEAIPKNEPIEILSAIPLKASEHSHLKTGGMAYIVQQGSRKNLVVQVYQLPKIEGSEVYQVWILKNSKREDGGIFKPDENGYGKLTYQLAEGQIFDQIGITVEPDSNSTQPRGVRIVGSL
ncbi:anti-sigma factor [Bacillus sp. FJAT-29790]|uniref:anti-sigma factor n=1 Tax=Bacillus sp. FJAT-29790 TaxID=1895002 RepID=UPI001C2473F6|nr:anti-sigma factor [Bacillus sp. FJAT-29790]MBU8878064.1 anti-sigma factor [Bacillus sp. FJAT-29790]